MDTRNKAIEVVNVAKSFGTYQALKGVSFDIYDNEFFTMLGPSGCGKTTLLRMIAGFEAPTSGTIRLHGKDILSLPPHKRRVNTVFQSYALFPHMTLEANIAFGLENMGWAKDRREARVAEMLAMVHMSQFARRKPAQLSGGQRQRVALARALAPEPEVLLLDEPLSALDLKLRQAMRDELRALQRATGITFVFVTHDQEEALDMSDRICVLGHGEIQHLGTPTDIYEDPENRFVADFIGETNFFEVDVLRVDGDQATVRTPMGVTLTTLHKGAQPGQRATLSLRPEKIGMEDQAAGELMEGQIITKNYMGGYTHYTVDVGGTELRVSKRNAISHSTSFDLGRRVKLGFRHDSARVLAR
ncbi:ABC transporter ATP-binding protein [Gemmobacter fulvus]|uniref:ABC transporter ATP-binding protein n=1 Tax=Gemmobacter fulvus TaxID=2840474 RepID=UPI002796BA50|nr:ABC transporter ATP-binding protein [Gemmobacter fulvus]MDQ1847830.1 ABC transporter ATP-binding protein [Gemmobacter fulvus]